MLILGVTSCTLLGFFRGVPEGIHILGEDVQSNTHGPRRPHSRDLSALPLTHEPRVKELQRVSDILGKGKGDTSGGLPIIQEAHSLNIDDANGTYVVTSSVWSPDVRGIMTEA